MATPKSLEELMASDAAVFRSLGTKSARQDLRRQQAKKASDLDGVGMPDPVYQEGPEDLDTELLRIYEGVDPATKELEKLRAESRELEISKKKAKGNYSSAENEADIARYARDAKRSRIGAKADNFSEALARSAYQMQARKADERNKPEPVTGSNSLPEPEIMSGGGLVDDGSIGPDYRDARSEERLARNEFNQLQEIYITRGAGRNVNPDGTPMSFRQFVAREMQARPDSPLAQAYAGGRAGQFFSATKDRFDDEYTRKQAKQSQYRADALETRRRAMLASRDGGLGVIADHQRRYETALETLRLKQQQGNAGPEDFLTLSTAQNALAGAYAVANQFLPGRGFDQMAAQMMISANRNNSLASSAMETAATNESMERSAASQLAQPPQPSAEDQLRAAIQSPVRDVEEQALATPLAGPNPTQEATDSALKTVRTATAELAAKDAVQTLVGGNAVVQPGTTQWDALTRYASFVDEVRFINALLPTLDDPNADPATRTAKRKRDHDYLLNLYRSVRPQRYSIPGAIGAGLYKALGAFVPEAANPPPPTER